MTILKDKKNELMVDEFLVKSKNNKFIMGLNQFGNMTAYMAKKEDAAMKFVLNLSFLANIFIILMSMPSLPVSVRTKYGLSPMIPICSVLFSYDA